MLPIFAFPVDAASLKQDVDFDLHLKDVQLDSLDEFVKFNVDIQAIKGVPDGAFWKIRAYCDESMIVRIYNSHRRICGKTSNLKQENSRFSFIFQNDTETKRNFSIKVKAYNEKGKWIHTDTENFTWK